MINRFNILVIGDEGDLIHDLIISILGNSVTRDVTLRDQTIRALVNGIEFRITFIAWNKEIDGLMCLRPHLIIVNGEEPNDFRKNHLMRMTRYGTTGLIWRL